MSRRKINQIKSDKNSLPPSTSRILKVKAQICFIRGKLIRHRAVSLRFTWAVAARNPPTANREIERQVKLWKLLLKGLLLSHGADLGQHWRQKWHSYCSSTDRGGMDKIKRHPGTLRTYSPWCQHKNGGNTLDFEDIKSCNQIKTWIENFSTTHGVPSMSQSSATTKWHKRS